MGDLGPSLSRTRQLPLPCLLKLGARSLMRVAPLLLVLGLSTGCASHPHPPVSSLCGGSSGFWSPASSAPPQARVLRDLADTTQVMQINKPEQLIELWFTAEDGSHMLCRTDATACNGEWWHFTTTANSPVVAYRDAWLCTRGGP